MFLKRIKEWTKSLTFRLGFLYSLIFGIISSIGILSLNIMISSHVMTGVDMRLLEQKRAVQHYAAFHDHKIIHGKFLDEAGARGTSRVFYRLLTTKGKQEVSSNQSSWQNIKLNKNWITQAKKHTTVFSDLKLHDDRNKARVLSTLVGKDHILQIIVSLENETMFLHKVQTASIILVILMLAAGIAAGSIMAKKAISGLDEITLAVQSVAKGDFQERVVLDGKGSELVRLGRTYNKMADKIETLLLEMQEVNDNIAHDLRSPVTSIRGMAEMAAFEKNLPMETLETLGGIVEECDRLIHLINTMLEISESEAGLVDLKQEKIHASNLINMTIEIFLPMADESGIELKSLDFKDFYFWGEKRKLQRIMANLVDNAIKYTPKGGKVIITALKEDNLLKFRVKDTGMGIEKDLIPKIFDRFYRADQSRTLPGNGLGLSLANAFARAHNGSIQIDSEINKGTTSILSIPFNKNSI